MRSDLFGSVLCKSDMLGILYKVKCLAFYDMLGCPVHSIGKEEVYLRQFLSSLSSPQSSLPSQR